MSASTYFVILQIAQIYNTMKLSHICLITEAQIDYLIKKYGGKVPQDMISKAIEVSPKDAEKLVYAYANGIINGIDADSLPLVANVDPFMKRQKTPEEIAYEEAITKAKSINRKHWQWIMKVLKANPEQEFQENWFHYIDASGITPDQLMNMKPKEIARKSDAWHAKLAKQKGQGEYKIKPGDSGTTELSDGYWIVPVKSEDAKVEGSKMGNCIGKAVVPNSTTLLFSLRNNKNEPHASISFVNHYGNWSVNEVKGKSNAVPVPYYCHLILPWLASTIAKAGEIRGSDTISIVRKAIEYNSDNARYAVTLSQYCQGTKAKIDFLLQVTDHTLSSSEAVFGVVKSIVESAQDKERHHLNALFDAYNFTATQLVELVKSASDIIKPHIVHAAIASKRFDEPFAAELINTYCKNMQFNDLLLTAVYRPEKFADTISRYHPDDVGDNLTFTKALEAYDGPKSSVFAKYAYSKNSVQNSFALRNLPIEDIIRLVADSEMGFDVAVECAAYGDMPAFDRVMSLIKLNEARIASKRYTSEKTIYDTFSQALLLVDIKDLPEIHRTITNGFGSSERVTQRIAKMIENMYSYQTNRNIDYTPYVSTEVNIDNKDKILQMIEDYRTDVRVKSILKLKLAALEFVE